MYSSINSFNVGNNNSVINVANIGNNNSYGGSDGYHDGFGNDISYAPYDYTNSGGGVTKNYYETNNYGPTYENVGFVNNGSFENNGVFTLTMTGTAESEVLSGKSGPDFANDVINALDGDDEVLGYRGADELDGGNGNDIVRAGNGRDIITGGNGADDLYGGFGQNTFTGEKDGALDYLFLKSDHLAVNWLYDKAGNNAGNKKTDVIASLDSFDRVFIQGASDSQLSFGSTIHTTAAGNTVSGIGIYASNSLEAIYTGGDLTVNQLSEITAGVAA